MTPVELLPAVKENLIIPHDQADGLLLRLIAAAVDYAESYQHLANGYYGDNDMPPATEQAVIMLVANWYESRDGSTGGFFADSVQASQQVWTVINTLFRLDRMWGV